MISKQAVCAIGALLVKLTSAQQYLITFGDSYSDYGFNLTTGPLPSDSNPIGNPPFPGYPSSGGANWVGDLVSDYNNGEVLSYSFAIGGASVDKTITTLAAQNVNDFVEQIESFGQFIRSTGLFTGQNSIVGVWFGVNDIRTSFSDPNSSDINSQITQQYFTQIQELYNYGMRNFVLLGVPPIDYTPEEISLGAGPGSALTPALADFRTKISNGIAPFITDKPDINIQFIDTVPLFMNVINNYASYGSPSATCTVLVDNPNCIWYEYLHPGVAIQKAVAAQVASQFGSFFHT